MDVKRIAKILGNKHELEIRGIILDTAQKDNQVVHGARAYNLQSPTHLRKDTTDYDILTKKPEQAANKLAERLRKIQSKEVLVSKGVHPGTYKVKIDGENIADYTQIKRRPKTVNSWGVKVKSLKSIKADASRLSKNPEKEFRRAKDLDTLDRIKKIDEMNKRFIF